ncbi:MAG TPA: hypothetical protein VEC76_06360 [Streptosporangiaceae bacterium]|nr:hypothetical protein [Streptosporangiaceae bacterium]
MPEPRDEVDTWLGVQVRPLLPPPGTFERITRQARRRRARRAVVAAAGAVAIAAVAAVVIPQVGMPTLETARQANAVGSPNPPASPPRPAAAASSTVPVSTAPVTTATGPPAPAAPPAPPRLSVTFVGVFTGWVMGQTTPAGQCDQAAAPACISLRRTDTAGTAWRNVNPPPAHGPDGATGVSQIRFLTRSDGWAFGPQLWATHDAGRTWTQIPTGGWRVTALEARGQRVFAVWARCRGTGPGFASQCTGFTVHSSLAASNTWALVPGASSGSSPAGTGGAASLMLTGTAGYLLLPDGVLLSGPLTGAAWQPAAGPASRAAPCRPGPAQPSGQPSGALLASTPAGLALLCAGPAAGGQQGKAVYTSTSGGQSWQRTGWAPAAGTAAFLSGSPSGALVLATGPGVEVSTDGGATWSAAGGTMPPGGFAYVGMTTAAQGVAVPAGPAQRTVWLTYDGGSTWAPSSASA